LGDLPALGPGNGSNGKDKALNDRDLDVALSLEVNINKAKKHEFMKADSKETSSSSPKVDPSLPKVSSLLFYVSHVTNRC
jgi:hypothetical protein